MARIKTGIAWLTGAATGAAAQYFLDAQAGARRRHTARDRALSLARRQAHEAAAKADYAAGHAKGKVASMKPTPSDDRKLDELGDAALARKVETEIFRAEDAPKGKVDVNIEHGVVFLRGEVERHWIERLERDAEHVNGVKAVRNLLHPPGTPAPTVPTPERTSIH
jgi:osmotically-inducible protein OsmY